jgi:hypothetical protein
MKLSHHSKIQLKNQSSCSTYKLFGSRNGMFFKGLKDGGLLISFLPKTTSRSILKISSIIHQERVGLNGVFSTL